MIMSSKIKIKHCFLPEFFFFTFVRTLLVVEANEMTGWQ